jgi:transposase
MQSILDLGADVDSRFIVIACAVDSFRPHRVANERKGLAAWLRTVPRGSRLAMESTGGYHCLLAELAHKAGLQVFVINPRDLRRYAEGVGQRGKTDRMDAEVIARYVAREHGEMHAYVPPTKAQRELPALIRRRAKLVETKASLQQSLRGLSSVRAEAKRLLADIDRVIARLELMMRGYLEQMPDAHQAAQRIATIPGFGALSSTWFAHSFTRVEYTSSDAVVAASGLDPRPADSGRVRGRRRLSKRGPPEARRILFNCARSASRTQLWRPYYKAQLDKGLSSSAATIILARKMLRVAFAVYKQGQPFDPARIAPRA